MWRRAPGNFGGAARRNIRRNIHRAAAINGAASRGVSSDNETASTSSSGMAVMKNVGIGGADEERKSAL